MGESASLSKVSMTRRRRYLWSTEGATRSPGYQKGYADALSKCRPGTKESKTPGSANSKSSETMTGGTSKSDMELADNPSKSGKDITLLKQQLRVCKRDNHENTGAEAQPTPVPQHSQDESKAKQQSGKDETSSINEQAKLRAEIALLKQQLIDEKSKQKLDCQEKPKEPMPMPIRNDNTTAKAKKGMSRYTECCLGTKINTDCCDAIHYHHCCGTHTNECCLDGKKIAQNKKMVARSLEAACKSDERFCCNSGGDRPERPCDVLSMKLWKVTANLELKAFRHYIAGERPYC